MAAKPIESTDTIYPLLPLRDVVVYPHMVVPLFVGREKSILALEDAMENNKQVVLVAQKNPGEDNPKIEDIYTIGTQATILQMLKLPDGTLKVLVEGVSRVSLINPIEADIPFMQTQASVLANGELDEREADVLMRSAISLFEQYVVY